MRVKIRGIYYDTAKSKLCAWYTTPFDDPDHEYEEHLYCGGRNRDRWFLLGCGGALTPWGRWAQGSSQHYRVCGRRMRIMPISADQARRWIAFHGVTIIKETDHATAG